jgi:uncharacterized protein YutE (UPF0331/DUF86 family)
VTDVELILQKIARLREQVELVRVRRPAAPDVLAADTVLRDALALALLVAVQEAIDIAYHVIADEGWGAPDSHAAAFSALHAHGVLDEDLATRVASVARVRNRIAHGYASVNHARLWAELPSGIDALQAYAAAVAAWLPADEA